MTEQRPPSPHPTEKKDPLTFDRFDRWGLGLVLGAVALVTAVVEVVQPALRWAGGDALPVEVVAPVQAPGLELPLGDDGAGTFEVLLPEPGGLWRFLDLLPGVLLTGMVLLGCWLLLSVMRTVAGGDPFHPANVRRLRTVGMLLVVGAPVLYFVEVSISGALLGRTDLGSAEAAAWTAVPGIPVVAGMVVGLLAEAFKGGSRLRDDVEGLV
ncbi:DUF2975 domain-containing protein [Oryzobacter terrae]|uniref:DUF2975 domain-containing protein n=1 Tax=Oryzobacter terrae TaxID=1620385 RepID=UPI00366CDCB1